MRALARRLAETSREGARSPWPTLPIRVTLVITELDVGGAEKAMVALATGLDRSRWSPTVLALGPEAPLADPLRSAGIPVACLGLSPRRPLRALGGLASALRRSRPALVQSFLFHANVATRLGVAAAWPPGARGRPWVLGGHRVAERQKRWHRALERLTARLGAGSVCVSEGVRRFTMTIGGWPADRLTVIPNAIDPAPFDLPETRVSREAIAGLEGVSPDAILILFVGRLNVQKGLPTLIQAASRLAEARPERDWCLAMVGDGPERDDLRAKVSADPNLAGRVRWLGQRRDVPALTLASDLLVLPSLWEGMPNVVLEAMAARLPVLATAVEGTVDLVLPQETGWLVPPGDPLALAEGLIEATADRDRLRRFGEAGRRRVEANFGPERTVAAYETLWAGLLGHPDLGLVRR
ncbi:MAG: glycosyltransferase [Isosphaeraceae bacterium]